MNVKKTKDPIWKDTPGTVKPGPNRSEEYHLFQQIPKHNTLLHSGDEDL